GCLVLVCWCGVVGLFFFSSRRRHTRSKRDWSSDVCSSDLCTRSLAGFLRRGIVQPDSGTGRQNPPCVSVDVCCCFRICRRVVIIDRKSTRLNSSHVSISYAVFCLKKKNIGYDTG